MGKRVKVTGVRVQTYEAILNIEDASAAWKEDTWRVYAQANASRIFAGLTATSEGYFKILDVEILDDARKAGG